MATGTVNKSAVDGLVPTSRDEYLWDNDLKGFGLKVTPAGSKVYLIQYRIGGRGAKVRRYTIGAHGSPWTPANARKEAERLLIQVRQGQDVYEISKARQRVAKDLAFRAYVERFVEGYLKENWPSSWADAQASLKRTAVPVLGDRPLPDITRADIKAVLAKLKGKTASRRNLYAVFSRMFRWALSEGDLAENPMLGMEAPPLPQKRDRTLNDWELRLAWLGAGDLGRPFGPIIRLMIALGQREEEVGGLEWRELDRSSATWHVPKERAKNKQAHDVPLNSLALAELDAMAGGEKWPRRGLVFSTTGTTAPSGYSKAKKRLDKAMFALGRKEAEDAGERVTDVVVEPWRFHDLRRTVSTGLQRLGVRFEVNEAVLNHRSGSKSGVAGVYQRHEWKDEKRQALDAWAVHLDRLVLGADQTNVIALAGRR